MHDPMLVVSHKVLPSKDECQSQSQEQVSSAEEANNIHISNGSKIIGQIVVTR